MEIKLTLKELKELKGLVATATRNCWGDMPNRSCAQCGAKNCIYTKYMKLLSNKIDEAEEKIKMFEETL